MTIFDDISNTFDRIETVQEKIIVLEVQACTPKSGKITGMPKSDSGGNNLLDMYLEKKEELEERLKVLNERLARQWKRAVQKMKSAKIDLQTQRMMYLRYCKGMQWKKCAVEQDKKYPNCNWNENKCFRKHREVLGKISQLA